jgi:hypothetical protein
MPETLNKTFSIQAPITKCYTIKKADGTERYVVEGLASGTELDLTAERMADTAIDSMVKSLEVHKIELNNEHRPDWDSVYGEVTELWKTQDNDLMMRAELKPWHYRTVTLVKTLEEGGQIALSIEGTVVDAVMEWSSELKRMVKTYKEILLKKISTTGTPAYANSWLTNITKSVSDWKELPMPKPLELPVKKTDVLSADEQPEVTPTLVEPVTPEVATPPAPEPVETPEGAENNQNPPVEPEAPAQEAEVTPPAEGEAAKSTPAPAAVDTSEVAKVAVLGDWAEADVVWDAIDSLSRNLRWFIWSVMLDEDKNTDEKNALIQAALSEFSALVTAVSGAMMTDGISDETVKSVEATREQTPEALAKSLSDQETKVEALEKSVKDKSTQLDEVTKTLKETSAQLEETSKSLKAEQEARQALDTELTTIKARKTLAFNEGARKAVIVDEPSVQPTNTLPKKRLQGVY